MPPASSTPPWLPRAHHLADTLLWPNAQITDQSPSLPLANIQALAAAGLLGVNVPQDFGGHDGNLHDIADLFEILGSACGVTLFVALQHMLACSYLSTSSNRSLRERFLPTMATGQTFATVAFSQIRRPGPPLMRCSLHNDSLIFQGVAPWSTGWGLASHVVLGGTLPDDTLVFALVDADAPGLRASPPMKLAAMNASATVSLTADAVQTPPDRFIKKITREELQRTDRRAMFLVAHLSHGVTRASLRHLHHLLAQRPSEQLASLIARLQSHLASTKQQGVDWVDRQSDPDYAAQALRIRAAAIALSLDAARAAVIASAGSANSLDHPAQRLFREAMLYSLTAQTRELQSAMLDQIAP